MYRVAEIVFNAENCGAYFETRAEKYRVSEGEPEFTVSVPDTEVEWLMARTRLDENGAKYLISGNMFYFKLIERGGMLIHSSAVVKDGRAYLFSGNPGVGKSTHTGYWLSLWPDAYIINDDKPAIRRFEDGFRVYGTPWSGKYDINRNEWAPMGGLAFVERAERNFIEPMPPSEAIKNMLAQTVRLITPVRMNELLDTMENLMQQVPVYRLGCTKDPSAAELACAVMTAAE